LTWLTDEFAQVIKDSLKNSRSRHPEINCNISDFSINAHSVSMISMLQEVLRQDLKGEKLEKVLDEFLLFEMEGWKRLLLA
jgi:hypothetical protein